MTQTTHPDRLNYRRYLRSALVGFLGCWLIFGMASIAQIGSSTPAATWIAGLYATRHRLSDSVESPKMVIMAGSSALFGISAATIQQETQVPTFNLGTHAGLGVDYLLHRTKEFVKPGDTVLLAPEYELYMADYKRSNTLVGYVFGHDPSYILSHPKVLLELPLERMLYGMGVKLRLLPTIDTNGYHAEELNQNGDTTANQKSQIGEVQLNKLKDLRPIPLKAHILENPAAFEKIAKFIEWCRSNNIKVIATWPNTLWFDVYQQASYQRLFQDIQVFYEKNNVPIAGTSRQFMYDKSHFYDTIYHLHDQAVTTRTQELVSLIKPLIVDSKPKT
jgi:hypothetical protein